MADTPVIHFSLDKGFINARDNSTLEAGELQELTGFYYKRGSNDIFAKAGRTVYNASAIGTGSVMDGFYAEMTFPGVTSQIILKQGVSLKYGNAALTGSFSTLSGVESASSTGMWHTFANNRYYITNGADPVAVFSYDVNTSAFKYRTPAGMKRPEMAPTLTEVASTATGSVLTNASSVTTTGDKLFLQKDYFDDGASDTGMRLAATVELGTSGAVSRLIAGNFVGSAETDWVMLVTLESVQTNEGRGSCSVQYTTNFSAGSPTWTTFETTNDTQPKRQVQIPIGDGVTSTDSAEIGVRIVVTKNGDKGKYGVNAYDVRLQQQDGAANSENTVAGTIIYWITEYDSTNGIESAASPRVSNTSPVVTPIYAFGVVLPTTIYNTNTTDFRIYRTTNDGAFPLGTLVGTTKWDTGTFYDIGPLTEAASTATYGVLEVASLFYERDLPPPISDIIATYQNRIIMVPIDYPNTTVYSAASYPESFPGTDAGGTTRPLNSISFSSDRDDRVMGLAPMSTMCGVFMKGRCKRIDHLPDPSDPTFGISPEDFATDHGLESKKGWCYVTPHDNQGESMVAYVARDGVRLTNLYQSRLITSSSVDWENTVDVTALGSSVLINVPSASQLQLYFTPTAAFRTAMGWDSSTNAVMILSYGAVPGGETPWRVSFAPANVTAAFTVSGISGKDYAFLLASGLRSTATAGTVVVDEVGTSDALYSYDTSGTIPHAWTTGDVYTEDGVYTWRLLRLVMGRNGAAPADATVTLTCGRDDSYNAASWSTSITYLVADTGNVHRPVNQGGQWARLRYVCNTTSGTHPSMTEFVGALEKMGWVV